MMPTCNFCGISTVYLIRGRDGTHICADCVVGCATLMQHDPWPGDGSPVEIPTTTPSPLRYLAEVADTEDGASIEPINRIRLSIDGSIAGQWDARALGLLRQPTPGVLTLYWSSRRALSALGWAAECAEKRAQQSEADAENEGEE